MLLILEFIFWLSSTNAFPNFEKQNGMQYDTNSVTNVTRYNAHVLLFVFSLINPLIRTYKLDDKGITAVQKDNA